MPTYECVDEMTIDGTAAECFASLADEVAGRSAWWVPFVVMRPKDEGPAGERNDLVERLASPEGTTDRYWSTARMSIRVTGVEADRRVVLKEEGGDFRGFEEWTFEPLDDDRTLVRVHWLSEPHGLMRLVAPFSRVVEDHSFIVREGLRGMGHYVAERRRRHRSDGGPGAADRPRG
ncbi:MAG: hypothetical protein F2836_04910 [Actinobacteria bacterium]|uniref:Unannotated protein n=1 Tax=freshwater metagenome TaxID=449393 RepID=A0A6J7IYZ8_9ZZZZ|nr:hypothetical protein [Actinomycetota bacterium]